MCGTGRGADGERSTPARSPCRLRARQDTPTVVVMQAAPCVATRPGSDCRCRRRGPEVRPDRGRGDGAMDQSREVDRSARPYHSPRGMGQARQIGEAATRLPATVPCRRRGRRALVGGPAGPGGTGPSRPGSGGGVAPAQLLPAAAPASRQRHGRLLVGRCRPASSPWLATGGPAPPPSARCRAPGTAARRGCRTAGRGCGTPGSEGRRSAGCTDGGRRASASRCSCGPCRAPSRTPIGAGC